MMISELGVLACVGLVAAVALGGALTKALEDLAYGTDPSDPRRLVGAAAVMAVAMFAAAWWPARRATAVQPVAALRCD